MSVSMKIELLGTMIVHIDGQPLPKVRSRKAKWLLAFLALRGGKPVSRAHVATMLWPDGEASTALANLRSVVSDLRQALGSHASRLQTPDRRTLAFDFSEVDIDSLAFDLAIQTGNLETAVALYTGPLLQDCDEEWVGPERSARQRDCLAALRELAKQAEPMKAVELAQQAAVIAPCQDSVRRDLMVAHVRLGDINAALAAYREFAQGVRAAGGVPDAQTTDLYVRIRSGECSVAPLEAPTHAPAPVIASSFIGREDERIELAQLIRSQRLVTLCGEGGIGKTRLAREVGNDLRREFSDGVCFVSLETAAGEESLLHAIARSLRVKRSTKSGPLESVVDSLKAKRILLLLDNCEHLLAPCARLVSRLLSECAHLRILSTSREPLGLVGESVWGVPGLTVPDTAHLPPHGETRLRVLMGYESVRLFVERAQATARNFEMNSGNAAAVAELCATLEGSPLAIELAAGRARTMSVSDILERFRADRLNFLAAPRHAEASRHQNLRRTLDWSHSLLGPEERRAFARLAIFSGGWTLEAAEAVADVSPPLLESLVEKSLVKFSPQGRYGFLETVREYGAERLANSGETPRLGRRHVDYFASFAERLEAADALQEEFEREISNFKAAMDCAESDPETTLRLATALFPYWERTFTIAEGCRRLRSALDQFPVQPSALRARATYRLGSLRLGDSIPTAVALFQESVDIGRKIGDSNGTARSLFGLGRAFFYASDYVRASIAVEECISLALKGGDKLLIGGGKGLSCFLCLLAGEYARARTLGNESLILMREVSGPKNVAAMLRTLGTLAYDLGDYDLYRRHNEEAIALYRSIGFEDGAAWCLMDLGRAATDLGEVAMGRELIEAGMAITRKLDDRFGTASAREALAYNHLAQGNVEAGRLTFQESLSDFRALGDRNGVARILDGLGDAASGTNAEGYYREAMVVWRDLNCRKRIRDGFLRIGDCETNLERSVRLWAHAYRMSENMGAPIPLPMRARHEEAIRAAKRAAGFVASWADGENMSLDAALDLAISA